MTNHVASRTEPLKRSESIFLCVVSGVDPFGFVRAVSVFAWAPFVGLADPIPMCWIRIKNSGSNWDPVLNI